MISWTVAGLSIWLGILTSISPCPLSTNIAAMTYLSRNVRPGRRVLWPGLFYALGRILVYVILGAILVSSVRVIPAISLFLQKYMHIILGPILIITGLILLSIIKIRITGPSFHSKTQENLAAKGASGAFFLGALFALAFCPVSAALFFGNILGLAVQYESALLIPALFGIGTALPVILFAIIITFAMHRIGQIFNRLTLFERWARRISGIVFVLAGLFYSLQSIIG